MNNTSVHVLYKKAHEHEKVFSKMAVQRVGSNFACLSWFCSENMELFEARYRIFKISEIYKDAGTAFNKLSEVTMLLQSPGCKWSNEDVEMLHMSVHRFAVDLNKINRHIKNNTASQIHASVDKKEAAVPVRQASSTVTSADQSQLSQETRGMLNSL